MNTVKSFLHVSRQRACGAIAILALFVAAAAAPVSAQSINQIVVKVPFSFTVGKKLLPAGEYTLASRSPNVLVLRSADNSAAAIFTAIQVDNPTELTRAELTFDRYGDEYFLAQIRPSAAALAFKIPRSHDEERLAKASSGPQVITVVADHR